jgi:CelD/BcsL family acetyltransferase involved in cellulose biosynthesis
LLVPARPKKVLQVQVAKNVHEMDPLRTVWERLCESGQTTIFQNFEFNRLAAEIFLRREAPYVVYVRASYGEAIVPAVLCEREGVQCIRLLGEELFDYRKFLHAGDEEVLRSAVVALSELDRPLEITALRQSDARLLPSELPLSPFTSAPGIRRRQLSPEIFAQMHLRLARNLRRMRKFGFEVRSYNGENSELLRAIYEEKAAQDASSLFRDPLRVHFMVRAGANQPQRVQIFTLESAGRLGAALVTLLDPGVRRFYTCWFTPELSKHSPALSLIYEVTRQSLDAGMDCDYMTGEQPYKLRLATNAVQLVQLHATAEQLAGLAEPAKHELRLAG